MSITKTIRFEVFKRDGFQCQYCGKHPPQVVLEIDHILPRKRKGKNDIENLITACFDCNRGKGTRDLKVSPVSIKERTNILKEKEAQLKEFYKLQAAIQRRVENDIECLCVNWLILSDSENEISEIGRVSLKNLLKNFPKIQIKEAMEIAWATSYVKPDGKFKYMCGVLWTQKRQQEDGNKDS